MDVCLGYFRQAEDQHVLAQWHLLIVIQNVFAAKRGDKMAAERMRIIDKNSNDIRSTNVLRMLVPLGHAIQVQRN